MARARVRASADEETGARVVTLTCTVFNTAYQLCRLRAALKAAASSEKTRVVGGETRTAVHLVMASLRPGKICGLTPRMSLRKLCSRHCVPSFTRDLPSCTPSARPSLYTLRRARGSEQSRRRAARARGWGEEVSLAARPCSLVERARVAQTRIARGVARGARDGVARAASPHGDARGDERTRRNICPERRLRGADAGTLRTGSRGRW